MCRNGNGLQALIEDDVNGIKEAIKSELKDTLIYVAIDRNAELRHTGHSVIMALEALRLEIRAHKPVDEDDTEAWKHVIALEVDADTLGTSALQDTLAAEQMSLDDVTIS